jgi:hypothetical protein
MRKLFWCCTAAGVLAAGGVYTAARYACCHPDTVVGGLAATTATSAVLHLLGRRTSQETAAQTCPADLCIPDEPRPIDPPATADAGWANEWEHARPLYGSAPIVIHDDDPPAAESNDGPDYAKHCPGHYTTGTLCPPAIVGAAGVSEASPPTDNDETATVCPAVMPYCTDDEAPAAGVPAMPPAEEDKGAAEMHAEWFRFWMGFFHESGPAKGTTETAVPPAGDTPKCQEDPHYHEHYSGVPYTGGIQPAPSYQAKSTSPNTAKKPGQEECSEPATPKKHKANYPGGKCGKTDECPAHPEIDTMEYRRSDGRLDEYGPGGPF